MQARLTNRNWQTVPSRCSVMVNYLHEADSKSTAIGLRFTIQELPGPMKLGGQLDVELSFDEAETLANRLLAAIGKARIPRQN